MSIKSIKDLAFEVAGDLRENKMHKSADSLSTAVVMLDDPETKINALKQIESACHVKAFGDLFLETLPEFEWPKKVSRLRTLCQAQLSNY